MNKIIEIKGMMCIRCEAHVKKALEAVPGVEKAEPSHEADKAELTLSADVAAEELKKAVEEAGYEYIG